MQTFGSQVWDTSLGLQALLASNLTDEIGPTLAKGHDFLKKSQVIPQKSTITSSHSNIYMFLHSVLKRHI